MPEHHYINNKWVEGTGESFQSLNPANGKVVWEGKAAGETEINTAVESAQKAFVTWSQLSLQERIAYLEKFSAALAKEKDNLAHIISQETGKPLWDTKGEVASMINKVAISIDAYKQRCGDIAKDLPQGHSITRHKPHGVVAVFGPFNFPGHLPNGHIIPALLAGNTVIFKPSELTPAVAEKTLILWDSCGLPPGVIHMLQGAKDTGKLLAGHPKLNGLFFTGSWPTGKILLEQLAGHPEKILALELGGNNPLIVHDVQDIQAAAYVTVQSAYLSSGQRCTCARRLILTDTPQAETFLQELTRLIKDIKVDSFEAVPEPFMGPVISEKAAKQILAQQEGLKSQGGKPLIEMKHLRPGTGLLSPGLMDVSAVADLPDQEIFGPFLQLIRVPNLKSAIEQANRTAYGLSAGILTDKKENYEEFYKNIRAGVVNWNTQLTGASSGAPFGGVGHSGNHRPSAYYAADYCSYPVASIEAPALKIPETLSPGLGGKL